MGADHGKQMEIEERSTVKQQELRDREVLDPNL